MAPPSPAAVLHSPRWMSLLSPGFAPHSQECMPCPLVAATSAKIVNCSVRQIIRALVGVAVQSAFGCAASLAAAKIDLTPSSPSLQSGSNATMSTFAPLVGGYLVCFSWLARSVACVVLLDGVGSGTVMSINLRGSHDPGQQTHKSSTASWHFHSPTSHTTTCRIQICGTPARCVLHIVAAARSSSCTMSCAA